MIEPPGRQDPANQREGRLSHQVAKREPRAELGDPVIAETQCHLREGQLGALGEVAREEGVELALGQYDDLAGLVASAGTPTGNLEDFLLGPDALDRTGLSGRELRGPEGLDGAPERGAERGGEKHEGQAADAAELHATTLPSRA